MYEDMTYQTILARLMTKALEEYPNADVREGSIIHMAHAPASVEFQNVYIELGSMWDELFADTASREYLIRRAAERGITPVQATFGEFKGVFNAEAEIVVGETRFGIDIYTFLVVEQLSTTEYKLVCETAGKAANAITGTLIPLTEVNNLLNAELVECLIPGEEEEETESLRERYFDSLSATAYGGNAADYKLKVGSLTGVGSVKVFPAWNGGGTVKLVLLDSDYGIPNEVLVESVQTQVDPVTNSGEGVGIAPIGHSVTVVAANGVTINVASKLTYAEGYKWSDIETNVQTAVENYLLGLRQTWEDSDIITVRVTGVEQALLSVTGIVDLAGTTINGGTANIVLASEQVPIRGDVVDNG